MFDLLDKVINIVWFSVNYCIVCSLPILIKGDPPCFPGSKMNKSSFSSCGNSNFPKVKGGKLDNYGQNWLNLPYKVGTMARVWPKVLQRRQTTWDRHLVRYGEQKKAQS